MNGLSMVRRYGLRWRMSRRGACWSLGRTLTFPKHRGLTYFIVDMNSPGVEVRPLYQITGEAEFNEVYFTDTRIPDGQRISDVGDGWRVALTTLMNERVAIGSNITPRGAGAIASAVEIWQESGSTDRVKRDKLTKLWIEAEAMRLTNMRASDSRKRGVPGPEGSTGKLHWADLNKKIAEFAVDLLGAEGMLLPGGYTMTRPDEAGVRPESPGRPARLSSDRGRIRSKGEPLKSCATFLANECSVYPVSRGSTRICLGRMCRAPSASTRPAEFLIPDEISANGRLNSFETPVAEKGSSVASTSGQRRPRL